MQRPLRLRALLAAAFLVWSSLACGPEATRGEVSPLSSASPAVRVLHAANPRERASVERGADSPALRRAVDAWRASPGEEGALGLARAYFPELSDGESSDPRSVPEDALRVRFPSTAGEAMELQSWGHVFRIHSEDLEPVRLQGDAAFSTSRRFFMPSGGRALTPEGRWKTPRVEEYVVLEEAVPEHRMRYTVRLPEGVVGARDAGEYLELLDARDVPVLRMHGILARDAAGQERRGTVHVRGATLRDVPADGMARYTLHGTLQVELAVELSGMTAPVVVEPGWSSTGSLATRRQNHTATLLQSGKVLVVGGHNGNGALFDAELYDPATGTWSSAGSTLAGRQNHTATLLQSGKVLVTGGFQDPASTTRTAVLYEPTTGTWSLTREMAGPRVYHAAVLLPSGKVAVLGGSTINATLVSKVEQYDPVTGNWSSVGQLSWVRVRHTATLLPSGRVLVIGGSEVGTSGQPAEQYDPTTGFSSTVSAAPRPVGHTTTLLKSGKVLIAGDYFSTSAWVFDPVTGLLTYATMPAVHYFHAAAMLPSGRVLLTGGAASASSTSLLADLYDPVTRLWQQQPWMLGRRKSHQAVTLPSGKVLLVGGHDGVSILATSALFDSGEQAPVAQALSASTFVDTPVSVNLVATDANGDALTYQVVSGPTNGTLTGSPPNLTYTPAPGFSGQDSFTWKASDGGLESNLATVSLTIRAYTAPVAQPLSVTVAEDTPVALTLPATDADGDALSYQVVSGPTHGTLTGTPPNLTYTPAPNFIGQDSFTWKASDGRTTTAPMTVTLTVNEVNDAPVALAFSLTLAQDTQAEVTLSGSDEEGSALTYLLVSWPLNGWLSGTPPHLSYSPVRSFSGSDSFVYQVSDGKQRSAPVTVSLTVTPGGAESFLRRR